MDRPFIFMTTLFETHANDQTYKHHEHMTSFIKGKYILTDPFGLSNAIFLVVDNAKCNKARLGDSPEGSID